MRRVKPMVHQPKADPGKQGRQRTYSSHDWVVINQHPTDSEADNAQKNQQKGDDFHVVSFFLRKRVAALSHIFRINALRN